MKKLVCGLSFHSDNKGHTTKRQIVIREKQNIVVFIIFNKLLKYHFYDIFRL